MQKQNPKADACQLVDVPAMPRGGPRTQFTAAQINLALSAPQRPETTDCTLCEQCAGGNCASWRALRAKWVQSWEGTPAPDGEEGWAEWWKRAKAQHRLLVAASPKTSSGGKRHAPADSTPNGGGQRKAAPHCATPSARRIQLPESLIDANGGAGSSGAGSSTQHAIADELEDEVIGLAEALALVEAAEVADAADAAEATNSPNAAESAESVGAAHMCMIL